MDGTFSKCLHSHRGNSLRTNEETSMKNIRVVGITIFALVLFYAVSASAQQPAQQAAPHTMDQDVGATGQVGMRQGGMMCGAMMGHGMMGHGMMGHGMMGGQMGSPMMFRMMFALMDDGDGQISLQEFQAAHERIFKAMDSNKDGQVTFEEMQAFMHGRPKTPSSQQ
jgi:hypothetical protein